MTDLMTTFIDRAKRQADTGSNFAAATEDRLEAMSETELNDLDFGVVKLDDSGKILFYNQYESELSGVARADATGKNFFYDIAPCTNNRLFLGAFKAGVNAGQVRTLFFYTFTYKMKPTNVTVLIRKEEGKAHNWILVKKNF